MCILSIINFQWQNYTFRVTKALHPHCNQMIIRLEAVTQIRSSCKIMGISL